MPTKLSRTRPTLGSMTPPFPSPPSTAFSASIASTTLISPTAVRTTGQPFAAARSSATARGREVQHDRPALLAEPSEGGQGQRQLLADVPPLLVDDRQPVGVGVLGEADRRADGRDDLAKPSEVLLGRLGGMVVSAVGLAAQDDRPTAEPPEQLAAHPPPRPVAGVQGDHEPTGADRLDVDHRQHPLEMDLVGLFELADLAQAVEGCPAELLVLPALEDVAPLALG